MTSSDLDELVSLQGRLRVAAAELVAPGGYLIYSVCTVTAAESIDHPVPAGFAVDDTPLAGPWRRWGPGWRIYPQDIDSDGMTVVRYRRQR